MAETARVAIVAALPREVRPLVKTWPRRRKKFDGREFEFFESGATVVVCGGIGGEHARRATEAVIGLYNPALVISAGFAGALQADMSAGQIFVPRLVIDVKGGGRTDTGHGEGILLSFDAVADAGQKAKLSRAYNAAAVDMEAATVARGAEAHGIRFMACKVISDASDFSMPVTQGFVAANGEFQSCKFVLHVALRPRLWRKTMRLALDSRVAAKNLCDTLPGFASSGNEASAMLPAMAETK